MYKERYKKLNLEQKDAVDSIDGPVMVVAGPGSGKTELLSLRVCNILEKTDVYPASILCLTFTESACNNMRERLFSLIGTDAYRVSIHTFHSFGVEIIRNHSEFFYQGAAFQPADDLAQIEILRGIMENLAYDNPLNKIHPEQGYTYLKSIKSAITSLKKAGLSPVEFRKVLEHNKEALGFVRERVAEIMGKRLSKKSFEKIAELISFLRTYNNKDFPLKHLKPLLPAIADSLELAFAKAQEEGKTAPITAWKTKNIKLDDDGQKVLKEEKYLGHLMALADIYKEYREKMYARAYIDFDDMLLDAISAIENNESLRYELQENFLYIMVDEFQDTNDAQVRLFRLLTEYDNVEQSPNIMVVGDDDQAIYKFQGARVSNVLEFRNQYNGAKFVTLKNNYRSTQNILDLASDIIRQGEERLENIVPEIRKELVAANPNIGTGKIINRSFATREHEYRFIAREIKALIASGITADKIAIISRQHANLEGIVPFLQYENIPLKYDRQQNILLEPHIYQIIQISRFVISLLNNREKEADDLLPEILAYPFWGLSRREIWEISVEVRRVRQLSSLPSSTASIPIEKESKLQNNLKNSPLAKENAKRGEERISSSWFAYIMDCKNVKLRQIANFFLELREMSRNESLEYVMDRIIGVSASLYPDKDLNTLSVVSHHLSQEEREDDVQNSDLISEDSLRETEEVNFQSPFREYYFSEERFRNARAEYLKFLSSLNTFRNALREYKHGKILRLEHLIEFVDLHNLEGILITDKSSYVNAENAVELLTAHKAKGLEYDNVFVINCQNDVWIGRGRPTLLPMPANLPITIAGDNLDDKLRLFFVAITRAKSNLYLTSYQNDAKGKESVKLQFLAGVEDTLSTAVMTSFSKGGAMQKKKGNNIQLPKSLCSSQDKLLQQSLNIDILQTILFVDNRNNSIKEDERVLLLPLVEKYKMSVTHLNNFLNVTRGGPQLFLDQNLLHFPQAMSAAGSFGTAVHASLHNLYLKLQQDKKLISERELLLDFEAELKKQRMSSSSFEQFLAKGQNALGLYYSAKKNTFDPRHKIEFDFSGQNVFIGKARLSGKIDKIVVDNDEILVCDYKTGRAKRDWKGKTPPEKIQLYNYRRQLVFYKILVENSRQFIGKSVRQGILEFIEPWGKQIIDLPLEISEVETQRLKNLIMIVYDKIQKLDFPDISKYSADLKGIIEFEEELLSKN